MSGEVAGAGGAPWVAALLTMARELWVLRDRQRVLEELLAARGVVGAGDVEAWQPDPARQAEIDAECQAFVQRIVAGLQPAAGDPAP